MERLRPQRRSLRRLLPALAAMSLTLVACGGSDSSSSPENEPAGTSAEATAKSATGINLVSAQQAAEIIADPPEELVILDVRTPEEFGEGHIEGAMMLDFYREDFSAELAKLDPDVPYLLYCRSGNRSGQAAAMMETLGFRTVSDVDGGVLAWQQEGLPLTGG